MLGILERTKERQHAREQATAKTQFQRYQSVLLKVHRGGGKKLPSRDADELDAILDDMDLTTDDVESDLKLLRSIETSEQSLSEYDPDELVKRARQARDDYDRFREQMNAADARQKHAMGLRQVYSATVNELRKLRKSNPRIAGIEVGKVST